MPENLLALVLAAALAALAGFIIAGRRARRLELELARLRERDEALERQAGALEQEVARLTERLETRERELATARGEGERLKGALEAALERAGALEHDLRRARAECDEIRRLEAQGQAELARLQSRQKEQQRHFEQQMAQFEEQKRLLRSEFENLANRIFEAKGKDFTDMSRASLDALLAPFKRQMEEFRAKVEDIHHKETQAQAALKTELRHLQELNQKITAEAHALATALKGQKKMQGNWGELVLENVLDRSGLRINHDYRREVSFDGEQGRARPDVIVYLPGKKHLVIDAKVSLNAYTRYVNAEEESERRQALREHVEAIAARIKELSDKNYYALPGLNSPEMVFMFIPIESAFVEALKADESLFQKALEQNVLVATPTTLLTSLNIVRQLWRFEDQNRNTAELAERAGKVYDKLNAFLGSMDTLGRALGRAQEAYDKAYGQLYTGRGNLIKQASEFRKLGVSVRKALPEELVEKAEMELEALPGGSEPEDEARTGAEGAPGASDTSTA